jgi:uncharacterized protein involved in exopolysaccharide biosynthesis
MENFDLNLNRYKPTLPFGSKELVTAIFRYKKTAALCFFGILTGAILGAFLQPHQYTATTEFLVGEARVDEVVSPDATVPPVVKTVSEEDLNSEMQLLRSQDVLRQVVIACGLDQRRSLFDRVFGEPTAPRRIDRAVVRLNKELNIDIVKKSDLIDVTYKAHDPQTAAQVLRSLTDAYMQKHVAVHSPPGQFEFFAQETERYKKNLADAEGQLKQFSDQNNGVAPQVSRDMTLQKLSEFRSSLEQTRADVAATEQRIKTLEKQAGVTPERLTTSTRKLDDAQVLQSLKTTLMSLQLKRTELLTKYQPSYPLVQEVNKEIGETQAAIVNEEAKPLNEQTTDRNPTYAWINEELAKAKADYTSLQAKAGAEQAIVASYEDRARDLANKDLTQQDLLRTVKTDEENYLLYLHKQEEARMSEALDRTRILNVAVAEQPVAPSLPSNSPWPMLLGGVLFAAMVSIGGVLAKHFLDPTFRTPAEVAAELNVPLLAAVPITKNVPTGDHGSQSRSSRSLGRDHEYSVPPSNTFTQAG